MADEMVGQIPRVVDRAVQEARPSPAEERGTEEVRAGGIHHHAAVVADGQAGLGGAGFRGLGRRRGGGHRSRRRGSTD